MIGKKLGNLEDVIKKDSDLNRYILAGALDDISLGGIYTDPEDDFIMVPNKEVDTIMIRKLDGNVLSISLAKRHKGSGGMDAMNTVAEYVIHYGKPGFPVYNSRY